MISFITSCNLDITFNCELNNILIPLLLHNYPLVHSGLNNAFNDLNPSLGNFEHHF